jgi:2-keto-4-pentenoate hydratase/2-oxohepta-3-ene-1,7-dioic acid hydratase in catechol pathway
MGIHVARYEREHKTAWGVVCSGGLKPIDGDFPTLADFLRDGRPLAMQMGDQLTEGLDPLDSVRFLGPVTAPCTIVCQGLNYGDHRAEAGIATEKPPYNLMFVKASSALSGPNDDVIRPTGVQLLDYELELGLVIGSPITSRTRITKENLTDYIAGIVISNDVSARDVQIPQQQWFKGKSFRTFCPTGPYLYLLDKGDAEMLDRIDIRLDVNGKVRQESNTGQLIFKPAETLTELSGLMDLHPGDLIQTGTPGGVAAKAPPAVVQRIARFLLSEPKVMQVFLKKQLQNPNYLQDGDVMRLTMRTSDGAVDLGVMETRVTAE